jgi:hypothetical protein
MRCSGVRCCSRHIDIDLATSDALCRYCKQRDDCAGNQAAWLSNTNVVTQVVPTGTQYQMVVSEAQAQALAQGEPWFGGWATPDAVPSQAFARNNLAILPEFKSDVSYVVTVETTAPQTVNAGFAGPLGNAIGGASQVEFVGQRNLQIVGQLQPLPEK